MFSNGYEWVEEPRLAESSMMMLHTNPVPTLDTFSPSHYVDMDDDVEDEMDDTDYENADEDTTHLLDLSKK